MRTQEETLRAFSWLDQLFNKTLETSLFTNGVTDATGTREEGEVRGGAMLAAAHQVLQDCDWLIWDEAKQRYPDQSSHHN